MKKPEFIIEDDIPIPTIYDLRNELGKKRMRYPFDQLLVGQSFFVDEDLADTASIRPTVQRNNARNDGKKFTSRRVKDGTRVWRIK